MHWSNFSAGEQSKVRVPSFSPGCSFRSATAKYAIADEVFQLRWHCRTGVWPRRVQAGARQLISNIPSVFAVALASRNLSFIIRLVSCCVHGFTGNRAEVFSMSTQVQLVSTFNAAVVVAVPIHKALLFPFILSKTCVAAESRPTIWYLPLALGASELSNGFHRRLIPQCATLQTGKAYFP
jgi:hypothetical protein